MRVRDRERERERERIVVHHPLSCVCFDMLRKQIYHKMRRIIFTTATGTLCQMKKYRTQGMTFLKHSCTLSLVHRRRIYIFSTLKV